MISSFSSLHLQSFLRIASIDEVYQKYYSKIPKDVFEKLIETDPTSFPSQDRTEKPKKIGTYGQWVLKMYLQGDLPLEDCEMMSDTLETLTTLRPVLKKEGISFDIMKFKTPSELYVFIQENRKLIPPRPEELDEDDFPTILLENTYFLDKGEAEKVYEDESVAIFVPHTLEASQFYGYGSSWCTQYPDNFQKYSEKGDLFILLLKGGYFTGRWQFHFQEKEFTDFYNSSLIEGGRLVTFFKRNPRVSSFFEERFFKEKISELTINGSMRATVEDPEALFEDSNRSDLDFYLEVLSGRKRYSYNIPYIDIARNMTISKENKQTIKEYMEREYATQIREEGWDMSSNKDLLESVDMLEAEDIQDAVEKAYSLASSDEFRDNLLKRFRKLLDSYLGVDFSKWAHPEYVVTVDKRFIKDHWVLFYTENISIGNNDITKILKVLSDPISIESLNEMIKRTESESSASFKIFNSLLAVQLGA